MRNGEPAWMGQECASRKSACALLFYYFTFAPRRRTPQKHCTGQPKPGLGLAVAASPCSAATVASIWQSDGTCDRLGDRLAWPHVQV